ncbi:MAG: Dabb family protein [Oscillospiraceae bacterium]|jgi:quinol monooxygenase YgiN|nr:Dabb family protein [Oscillospiraceae bacterium]
MREDGEWQLVRHIVMWNFADGNTDTQNRENGLKIKSLLEAAAAKIEGVISFSVHLNEMGSSNRDILLFSEFESAEALERYQVSEGHKAAGVFVRAVTKDRACIDYEAEQ